MNKVDLPGAEPERVGEEIAELIGEPAEDVRRISAKTGEGVEDLLEELVKRVPPPHGDPDAPPRALIFDSEFDQYRGVIAYIRVVDGTFKKGEAIRAMATGTEADIDDIGFFTPLETPAEELHAGEVGYLITGIKDVSSLRVGDTLTTKGSKATEALPGYRDVKPMVFCGLFPMNNDDYPELRDALEKLTLNDAALLVGAGDLRRARLRLPLRLPRPAAHGHRARAARARVRPRADGDDAVASSSRSRSPTAASIPVHNPTDMPDPARIAEVREPYIRASILAPKEYIGQIMELCQERRGAHSGMHYLSSERVQITYDLPLAEIVLDFFDQLKTRTRGYASLDYEPIGLRAVEPGQARRAARRRPGRRAEHGRPPRQGLRPGQGADRAAAQEDPAPAVRRADPGRRRRQDHRPRDGQGVPQGRHGQVLRRRHLAASASCSRSRRRASGG